MLPRQRDVTDSSNTTLLQWSKIKCKGRYALQLQAALTAGFGVSSQIFGVWQPCVRIHCVFQRFCKSRMLKLRNAACISLQCYVYYAQVLDITRQIKDLKHLHCVLPPVKVSRSQMVLRPTYSSGAVLRRGIGATRHPQFHLLPPLQNFWARTASVNVLKRQPVNSHNAWSWHDIKRTTVGNRLFWWSEFCPNLFRACQPPSGWVKVGHSPPPPAFRPRRTIKCTPGHVPPNVQIPVKYVLT